MPSIYILHVSIFKDIINLMQAFQIDNYHLVFHFEMNYLAAEN